VCVCIHLSNGALFGNIYHEIKIYFNFSGIQLRSKEKVIQFGLQSSFLILHSASIDLQEAKDSIDEEDSRPTSST